MDDELREYPYQPKWWAILLSGAFFALLAGVFIYMAANNDHGVIINHLIELGPATTTVLLWVLAAARSSRASGAWPTSG